MLVDAENLMKEKHINGWVAQDREERVTGLLEWRGRLIRFMINEGMAE